MFTLKMDAPIGLPPRRMFKNANWKRVWIAIAQQSGLVPRAMADDEIEWHATRLTSAVESAIVAHVPVARPCSYAKRWWTRDLSYLRREYTGHRDRARAARASRAER